LTAVAAPNAAAARVNDSINRKPVMPPQSDPVPGAPYIKPWLPPATAALPPAPKSPAALATAPQIEVIIRQGNLGVFFVGDGVPGTLTRTQLMSFYGGANNLFQVAKLRGAKVPGKDSEEIDVVANLAQVQYEALFCGETFFQAALAGGQQKSLIVRLLSMAEKANTGSRPPGDYTAAPGLKDLVTKEGTPMNPLPGRCINLFGEGESPGFEDYSSDIDFCSHTFSLGSGPPGAQFGHRPWTHDPRLPPGPGIPDKSVNNICCRSSPIYPVTIKEILRVGVKGCRVTYAEASGNGKYSNKLKQGLAGAANVIAEGEAMRGGRAIVLELL
jgi:hypothetical protein